MTAMTGARTWVDRSVIQPLRSAAAAARLLLAAKTALAVGIVWLIAPLLPGAVDNYRYYAPLGVLVSMYPTLMDSARTAVQTLIGLAVGVTLSLSLILTIGPNWWTIPLVAGIGVLLSGTGWFGAGQEYVPIAAMFVLMIGGKDAEGYSAGYITQMLLGVVVGLGVNLLIAPGTLATAAAARIDAYQRDLVAHLDGIGATLEDGWPPEEADWDRTAAALADTLRDVRTGLLEADRSRKGNLRAFRGRHDTSSEHRRLESLEVLVVRVEDISDALADSLDRRPGSFALDPALAPVIGRACRTTAAAIDRIDDDSAQAHLARAEAARAVRQLLEVVAAGMHDADSILGPGVLIATHLRRIVRILHARG